MVYLLKQKVNLTSDTFVRQLPNNVLLPQDTLLSRGLLLDDIEDIDNLFFQGHIIRVK